MGCSSWPTPRQIGGLTVRLQLLFRIADEDELRIQGQAPDRNGFFAKTAANPEQLKTFKMHLVGPICEASGGPCKSTGKDMKTAHTGMGVSGADCDALVEDLVGALDKFKVGKRRRINASRRPRSHERGHRRETVGERYQRDGGCQRCPPSRIDVFDGWGTNGNGSSVQRRFASRH